MNQTNHQMVEWPWEHIWKAKIPYKVSCFLWLLAREAVLTQDNLMKRGITICPRCCLCWETTETVNHLFLHCKITGQVWRMFLALRSITWIMPGNISGTLECWEEAGLEVRDRGRRRMVPACIWWTIWKERNS